MTTNYYKLSEHFSRHAYVGGDAYNYIINGTHATALVVLASMLALVGTLSLLSIQLSRIIEALAVHAPEAAAAAALGDAATEASASTDADEDEDDT